MNSYTAVNSALTAAVQDITAGGELQILNQILQMKSELNAKIASSQLQKTAQVKAKIEELKSIKQHTEHEIPVNNDVVTGLKQKLNTLSVERKDLLA